MGRPVVKRNKYEGVLDKMEEYENLYTVTVQQDGREALLCGTLEEFLILDLVPGQEVRGRIVIYESKEPIILTDIEAFRVSDNLWRETYFSENEMEKDVVVTDQQLHD